MTSRVICRWNKEEASLLPTCGHSGHTIALYLDVRGDLILVGDLMKSLQLLVYKSDQETIELKARDFNPAWMSSAIMLDDHIHGLGAENNYNLFTVRMQPDSLSDEERCCLDVSFCDLVCENLSTWMTSNTYSIPIYIQCRSLDAIIWVTSSIALGKDLSL